MSPDTSGIARNVLHADVDLPVDVTAPGHARAWLQTVLTAWSQAPVIETAQLLTSELVTNAIRYGGPPLHVRLTCAEDVLRVTVADGTPDGPRLRDPHPDAESGRGMLLVEALSGSWGVEAYEVGKGVWFEFPRS